MSSLYKVFGDDFGTPISNVDRIQVSSVIVIMLGKYLLLIRRQVEGKRTCTYTYVVAIRANFKGLNPLPLTL